MVTMKRTERYMWWTIAGASLVGLAASLIQTIERIQYAEHPVTRLTCDINAIFSCSNVFAAWQSSVFGFSNSLICMMFFALTAGVALAAANGTGLHKTLRHTFHFFAVFFLGFGAWYLWQSTYVIGYICIFCLFCYAAVIAMNWAWFRLQYDKLPVGDRTRRKLGAFVKAGGDTVVAVAWALAIVAMMVIKFGTN